MDTLGWLNVTIPQLLRFEDVALLALRLMVAVVFGTSGYFHARDPVGRAKSVELTPTATRALGLAELAGSAGLGAIGKKITVWKTGFWGEKASGWHYDLMLLTMNLVILCTAGGNLVTSF